MPDVLNSAVIRLDNNPVGVFYSGQVISGSVIFYLDNPIKYTTIYIQFLGEANVVWTESEIETVNRVERHKLIKYAGREEYFNQILPLAGGTGGSSHLPAGDQSLPFRYQIPFTAPSSYVGEKGNVSYSMTVTLVYAEPSILKETMTKNFQVVAPLDLNTGSPRIRQPIELEFEEVYGCDCFCSPDPVTIRVRLPASGFCPGQVIPVGVDVQNKSSVEITKMIFQIIQKELYRSQYPVAEYIPPEKVLVTKKSGPITAHCKRDFTFDVTVPEMIAPFLENCRIIDVGYFFRVTIKLSGCNDDLQDDSEICLGLVPLREMIDGNFVHPMAQNLPIGPIPVSDGRSELAPPVTQAFGGSNTSLQRSLYNSQQNLPYASNNALYPTDNRFQTPVSIESSPYEIGFKVGDASNDKPPPYPGCVNPPPYPLDNSMRGVTQPGYPTDNMAPRVTSLSPYNSSGYAPSAPPPTD